MDKFARIQNFMVLREESEVAIREAKKAFRLAYKVGSTVSFQRGAMTTPAHGEILVVGHGYALKVRNEKTKKEYWIADYDLV